MLILSTRVMNANTNNVFELTNCKPFPSVELMNYSMLQLKETLKMGFSMPSSSILIYWCFEDVSDKPKVTVEE